MSHSEKKEIKEKKKYNNIKGFIIVYKEDRVAFLQLHLMNFKYSIICSLYNSINASTNNKAFSKLFFILLYYLKIIRGSAFCPYSRFTMPNFTESLF